MTEKVCISVNVQHIAPYIPQYQSDLSAGSDLHADIPVQLPLAPMQRQLIPTGVHIALPVHLEAQIRPRSGLSFKHGITVINSPGTIDPDYRGQIMVPVVNLSAHEYVIYPGDRIAQMVIAPFVRAQFIATPLQELTITDRGSNGFGSTGKK